MTSRQTITALLFSGQASVIDGDTLEIHATRIRLWGIDAPETDQLCRNESNEHYRCGQKAANDLDAFIARRPVECVGLIATADISAPLPSAPFPVSISRNGWSRTALRSTGCSTPRGTTVGSTTRQPRNLGRQFPRTLAVSGL